MVHNVKPLWIQFKDLDESWHSNPGRKYAKFMRLIAERIPLELGEDRLPRHQTPQDIVDWLIEQAVKVRMTYATTTIGNSLTHTDER